MARRKKTPAAHAPPPAGEEHRYATRRYWAARYAAVGDGDVFEWFLSFDDLRPLLGFVKRRSAVLDLGCGTSRLLCDMREAGYAGRLVGVDCAAAALRSVKERSEACHVELVEADATTLAPFADATFDVVVDKGTVDALISGDAAAATEACAAAGRVLKRGGRFVVVSHRRPDGDDAWLEAVLAGLAEVDAAWRVDAHASAGPAVYVFTKRRSACREVELVVHEYG